MGIGAIAYEYEAYGMPECLSQEDPGFKRQAFILIAPDAIDVSKVEMFWSGTRDDSPQGAEKAFIAALGVGPWKENGIAPLGLDTWKKEHLLNCRSQSK